MSILDQILPLPQVAEPLEWPAEFPDHLSATQLTMFSRCPNQWRLRYLLGQKERPGAAMIWGSADHYAHEQNFTQKILTDVDIPVADVQLAFAEGFDKAVDRSGGEGEIEWGSDKPAVMKDAGAALVAVYHRQVSPTIHPVAVEEKFSINLPGVPVPVIGYLDLRAVVADNGEPPTRRAIERKTAKQKQATPKPDWRLQGELYQAVSGTTVDWHVSTKTKTPAVYTPASEVGLRLPYNQRTVEATEVNVQSTARAIVAYWRMFGPHEAWPGARTHPWACTWCGWGPQGNATCRWWAT